MSQSIVLVFAALLPTTASWHAWPVTASPVRMATEARNTVARMASSATTRERAEATEIIKNLVVQRSLQTQVHYYEAMKNDFVLSWLLDFARERAGPGVAPLYVQGQWAKMNHHHAGLGPTSWEPFMRGMMDSPEETHQVTVVWGAHSRPQGSPGNPYLQAKRAAPRTYTDTVRPAMVARSVLTTGRTIAAEWSADLPLIELDNQELRRGHSEEVRSLTDTQARFQHAIVPEMSDVTGEASPLRLASYDLLKNAATVTALRRLIRHLDDERTEMHSAEWLRAFARAHARGFARDSGWHVAKQMLEELMRQPMSLSTSPRGTARFLDPVALGERLMDLRLEVARDWVETLEEVPADYLALEGHRLESLVKVPVNRPPPQRGSGPTQSYESYRRNLGDWSA